MRYFTKELFLGINDCNEDIRLKAETEWYANGLAYQQQFIEAKKHLPHSFVKNYLSRNDFHDYTILGITITKKGRLYSCELQLSNGDETISIAMLKIKSLQIDVHSFDWCVQGKLTWGYSEFEVASDNSIKLAILCDGLNELQFEFEKIKFRKDRGRFSVLTGETE